MFNNVIFQKIPMHHMFITHGVYNILKHQLPFQKIVLFIPVQFLWQLYNSKLKWHVLSSHTSSFSWLNHWLIFFYVLGSHHYRCVVFSDTLWVFIMKIHWCVICSCTSSLRLVKHRLTLFLVHNSHNGWCVVFSSTPFGASYNDTMVQF